MTLALRDQTMSRISMLTVLWLFSAVAAAQQDIAPAHLKCTGNEPFWSIDVGPSNALLDRVAQSRERAVYRGQLQRFMYLEPEWLVWRGQSIRQSTHMLTIVARREACQDTMADGPPADYRAVISFADGTAATGCCRARFANDVNEAPLADDASRTTGTCTTNPAIEDQNFAGCVLSTVTGADRTSSRWAVSGPPQTHPVSSASTPSSSR